MSAGKLQDKLDAQSKSKWSARSIKENVVLMDWSTNEENPPDNIPISILKNILQNVSFLSVSYYIIFEIALNFLSGILM